MFYRDYIGPRNWRINLGEQHSGLLPGGGTEHAGLECELDNVQMKTERIGLPEHLDGSRGCARRSNSTWKV